MAQKTTSQTAQPGTQNAPRQTVYIATLGGLDLARFEWKDPAEVQKTLEAYGFDLKDITMDSFLVYYRLEGQERSLIFFKSACVGQNTDRRWDPAGTTQTLGEIIDRYKPIPGLIFTPPYVALVEKNLYGKANREFRRKGWDVERIFKAPDEPAPAGASCPFLSPCCV